MRRPARCRRTFIINTGAVVSVIPPIMRVSTESGIYPPNCKKLLRPKRLGIIGGGPHR